MADVVTLVKQGHTHSTRTLIKIDQNVTRLQEQVGSANLSLDKFTATCQVLGKRVTSSLACLYSLISNIRKLVLMYG